MLGGNKMLEVIIPSAEYNDNTAAIEFVNYLKDNQKHLDLENATLYYNYPLFREYDEKPQSPSFFIVSPIHGIIIIDVEEKDSRSLSDEILEEKVQGLDFIYSQVLSKLIKIATLRKKKSRNEVVVNINTILYLPNYSDAIDEDLLGSSYAAHTMPSLNTIFADLNDSPIIEERMNDIFSVIDGTRAIPRPVKRDIEITDKDSKGGRISELELQIAKFDQRQKIAALTIIDGPQRIRGMAGSGKTIILAMKAALIHLENPEAKILYTFYTKSLYDQVKQLITRFYRMQEDHDPNWENIQILHAWGGKNLPGVYYNTCIENGIDPIPFITANNIARKLGINNFEYICGELLERMNGKIKPKYDYVLMDEGQDFPKTYYWLCRKLVKNDCLVWAYDELQNILDIEIQETKKLFENPHGDRGFDLADLMQNHPHQNNDIVLHKSYRNPIEVLMVSHALGFGLYNQPIIQMLENKDHWHDLGYEVIQGNCIEGEQTIIERPIQNSPSIISNFYEPSEIVKFSSFDNWDEEIEAVCNSIEEAIQSKLLPEDIMVISVDDKHARSYFERIELGLARKKIKANNILRSYSGDNFIAKGKVTLSTVYRAKGNEAAMVFVIGIDSLANQQHDIIARNKIFTSFTRTKAWLNVSGVGRRIEYIKREIDHALEFSPRFEFIYPSLEKLKTHRRELAQQQEELNRKREKLLGSLDSLGIDSETALRILKGELDQ